MLSNLFIFTSCLLGAVNFKVIDTESTARFYASCIVTEICRNKQQKDYYKKITTGRKLEDSLEKARAILKAKEIKEKYLKRLEESKEKFTNQVLDIARFAEKEGIDLSKDIKKYMFDIKFARNTREIVKTYDCFITKVQIELSKK